MRGGRREAMIYGKGIMSVGIDAAVAILRIVFEVAVQGLGSTMHSASLAVMRRRFSSIRQPPERKKECYVVEGGQVNGHKFMCHVGVSSSFCGGVNSTLGVDLVISSSPHVLHMHKAHLSHAIERILYIRHVTSEIQRVNVARQKCFMHVCVTTRD